MKKITIILLLLVSFTSIGQIKGKVIDSSSNTPLEYATIALYKDSEAISGVVTDEEGYFNLKNVEFGNYKIEVSFLGYQSIKKEIEYTKSLNLGDIIIDPSENYLNEVVIKNTDKALKNKIDKQVINAKSFESTKGGTGLDVVKNIPSVNLNSNGEISVRGTNNFVALINGKPVQGDPNAILAQIPANSIKNVELITAPSAKYDPEGKGGILNIVLDKKVLEGSYSQINTMLGAPSVEDYDNKENAQRYGADGTFNYVKGKWNLSLGASYQRFDKSGRREGFHDPSRPEGDIFIIDDLDNEKTIFPSDGERSFNEENYSGKVTLDFTPSDSDNFSVGFYAGKRDKARTADIYYNNETYQPIDSDTPFKTFDYYNENLRIRRGDFMLGSLDYTHEFENESKISASALYEYTLLGGPTTNRNLHTDFPNNSKVYQDERNSNDNPLYGTRLNLDFEKPLDENSKIETGYQYRNLDHTGDFFYERLDTISNIWKPIPEFSSTVNLNRDIHSAYVTYTAKRDKWSYNAGVRLEHMDRDLALKDILPETEPSHIDSTYNYNYTKLFPSGYLQYETSEDSNLKIAYSKRVNRTTTFKMNPFREREHSETLEQGDAELKPEFTDLTELTFSKDFDSGNSFYATAYYRYTENLVNRVNRRYYDEIREVYADTVLDRVYSNVGRGQSLGLDIGGNIKVTDKWRNLIGTNIYNYYIDGAFDGKKIDQESFQYSIDLNSTYEFSERSSLEFNLSYLSKRVTAQGEDSEFYLPNLSYKHTFLDGRLVATVQWKNMDLGLLNTNEQRITTFVPNEFYTTTNYVYEVDMFLLNLSYTFNNNKNKSKFIKSEFGKREF